MLNADLNSPTNLFQVDPVTFVNAGNVFAGGLPGLWLFVDGRTLYGVNLAVPATRVALATLATGETVMNHLAADGSAVYVAINAAATSRVLRVPPTLVASNVSSFDAPAVDLTLTTTRVVARLSSTPSRIVSAPKTGGSMLTIHTAAVGDTLLALLGSGENVYASKLSVSASSFGYSSLIVGADGSNMQTLANTSLMRGVGPNPLLISQGLSQVYAVLLVDGLSTEGSYAGATLRAVEGATRNTLTTFGNFAPGGVASAFIFGLAPMQYGKTGLISLLAAGANANIATGDLYFFKSDSAGLVRVTTFVPANAAPAGAVQTPSPQSLVRAAARRGLR